MPLPAHSPEIFPPVPEDEMAFAMSYFMGAADQKFGDTQSADPQRLELDRSCERLFAQLYASSLPTSLNLQATARHRVRAEMSLVNTFKVVCVHYQGNEHLVSICARVLGFYLLMEQTAGEAVAEWTAEDPSHKRYVTLSHEVVEALASFPLGGSVRISPLAFISWVRQVSSRDNP